MGILVHAAIAALAVAGAAIAGCYDPSLRDCTVSCASPGDCASSQVCGADGKCAAPEVAGRCGAVDARGRDDARLPGDADVDSPDARATVALHVQVSGKGSVLVDGIGACSSQDPQRGDCLYDVTPGVPLTAHAIQIQSDQVFAMWMSTTCAGQGARCVFTPVAPTTINARFVHP
jgi:hypothetical protein